MRLRVLTLFGAFVGAFLVVSLLVAQVPAGFVRVSQSRLLNGSDLVASGQVCAVASVAGRPISVRVGGGGTRAVTQQCVPVTNGSWSMYLPDTSISAPLNATFLITATDGVTGDQLLYGYTQVQPTSVTNTWCNASGCNFDVLSPNLPALAVIQTGPAGKDGQSITGPPGCVAGTTCLSAFTPQVAQVVVAASDSLNKASASVVVPDTDAQVSINAAINACPAGLAGSTVSGQCVVHLQAGTYNLSGSIVIDRDNVTLEGDGYSWWGPGNYPYDPAVKLASTSTHTGTKLHGTAGGFPLIVYAHSNATIGGPAGTRHSALHLKHFELDGYVVTSSGPPVYANDGIAEAGPCTAGTKTYHGVTTPQCYDDQTVIEGLLIHHTNNAVSISSDTPIVKENSIQDNSGDALHVIGVNARVYFNLLFDNAGQQITGGSVGGDYVGNQIGNTLSDGIHIYEPTFTVSSNSFSGIVGNAIVSEAAAGSITGNKINYTGDLNGYNTNGRLPTSNDAIYLNTIANGVSVVGNTLDTTNVASGGYAIHSDANFSLIAGNAISGPWHGAPGTCPVLANSTATVLNTCGSQIPNDLTLPQLKATSGKLQLCVDSNGLVSAAASCAN